jgi:5-methyltetrahydrofolate--homocysteine methyltransferase
MGVDMIMTNSLGGSSLKLRHYCLEDRAYEINKAAAMISRKAAVDNCIVLASMGPSGLMLVIEEVTSDELYESFKEQVLAFEAGSADAVCIETMSDIEEACIAIKAAKENTSLEIACTFTFDKTVSGEYRTMMGASPEDAALAAIAAGADIIGTNCGSGIERMIDIVVAMKSVCGDTPIIIQANAGMPTIRDGVTVFPETPEYTAQFVPAIIAAGAKIIGGCCGTTPDHIRAIKNAIPLS